MADFRPLLDLAAEAPSDPYAGSNSAGAIAAADEDMHAQLMNFLHPRRHQPEIDYGSPEAWGAFADDQPIPTASTASVEGTGNGAAAKDSQKLIVWDEFGANKRLPTNNRDGSFPGSGPSDSKDEGPDAPGDEGEEMPKMTQEGAVATINRYMEILNKSESGRALVEMAKEMNIKFAIDMQAGVYGYYSPGENLVGINPTVDEGRAVATLAHELRHAWQFKNGFNTKLEFKPRDNIWMMRAMEADAEANAIKLAAELAEAGYPAALQSHLNSEYGDEAMAFIHQVQEDPTSLTDGRAQRAVFDQWFSKTWRRDAYDKHSVDYLEHFSFALEHNKKTKGFDEVTVEWLRGMGAQPDGSNYLDPKDGSMDLDDDFYREGIASPVEDRLEHIERRLDGVKRGPNRRNGDEAPLKMPPRGAANDDRLPGDGGLPIAAELGKDGEPKPPRLLRAGGMGM
ncbi:MAG: hypothetical protein KI792_02895 [Alphaproteobacteria bacterium]|nr:hypothetical protein [Alphaproteobacteria bacterium SS10]